MKINSKLLAFVRSPWLGACTSHTKPMSGIFTDQSTLSVHSIVFLFKGAASRLNGLKNLA